MRNFVVITFVNGRRVRSTIKARTFDEAKLIAQHKLTAAV